MGKILFCGGPLDGCMVAIPAGRSIWRVPVSAPVRSYIIDIRDQSTSAMPYHIVDYYRESLAWDGRILGDVMVTKRGARHRVLNTLKAIDALAAYCRGVR